MLASYRAVYWSRVGLRKELVAQVRALRKDWTSRPLHGRAERRHRVLIRRAGNVGYCVQQEREFENGPSKAECH